MTDKNGQKLRTNKKHQSRNNINANLAHKISSYNIFPLSFPPFNTNNYTNCKSFSDVHLFRAILMIKKIQIKNIRQ